MRIGPASIYVEDQDKAEQFYTQALGFQVKTSAPSGPEERWLSLVSPEDPDGVQLVLHLADTPARWSHSPAASMSTPSPTRARPASDAPTAPISWPG
jgi:catechol 2,3-dioxygenase-like lactoylglutathione lyase family enzyme